MTAPRIGFIGLGNMGGRMTACLVRAGVDVLGFDAREGAAAELGAAAAATAAAVVAETDVVLLSLPDSKVVETVVYSDPAFLQNVRPGQVIVDLSTSAPASTRSIAADVA